MTTRACHCPDVPSIETVPSGPLRCSCCGGELAIVCPQGCARPRPPKPPRERRTHYTYAEKPCRRCGTAFQPSGPNARYCAACRGAA